MTLSPAPVRELELEASPTSVLRGLRGTDGLVALVGDWCGGGAVLAYEPAVVLPEDADPFALPDVWDVGPETAGFHGGWIGLWGYRLHHRLERTPPAPPRPHPQREHWLARYDWVLRYDVVGRRWWFESVLPPDQFERAFGRVVRRLADATPEPRPCTFDPFVMDHGPERYRAAIAKARHHIWAGDIFQANICTSFTSRVQGDPLDAFCSGVDALAPAYAAYIDTGDRQVVSLSPELFLRMQGREVTTRPIKGTAPATQDPALLARSAKDRAENVMIVDLMRNDLGRVCETGTVKVTSLAAPERGAGVRHLVSEIRGTLPEDASVADLLTATFPPGSVTGAPKVRAMEVIHDLEATGRELYTGAIGYLSPVAGLETSVVIRTFEIAGDDCWIGVGCGIVADSDPDAEVAEAFTKLDPLLAAVGATRAAASATTPPAPAPTTDVTSASLIPTTMTWPPDTAAGVFDTLLVRAGQPVELAAHLDRLAASVEELYAGHVDRGALEARIREAAQGMDRSRVRLTFVPETGSVEVICESIGPDDLDPRTLEVRRHPGGLGAHKWSDRRAVNNARKAADVLLVDETGHVLECGTANIFVVLDDQVCTPPLDGRILPGTVRRRVLDLIHRHGIPMSQRTLPLHELAGSIEVFSTSSIRGVQPIVAIHDVGTWPVGPMTTWLREKLSGRPAYADPGTAVRGDGARVLIVDNYDSFTYNLAQRLRTLGAAVDVLRNDRVDLAELRAGARDGSLTHVVISPGPGRPEDAGRSVAVVQAIGADLPVLGVCLGHQCIGAAYGASVVCASRPVHGSRSLVHHDGKGVYRTLEAPFVAGRYHSLVLTDLPDVLAATAYTAEGVLMGVRHRSLPVEGVQVHPESILTDFGDQILGAFLWQAPASHHLDDPAPDGPLLPHEAQQRTRAPRSVARRS